MADRIVTLDIGGKAEIVNGGLNSQYEGLKLVSSAATVDASDYEAVWNSTQTIAKSDRPILRISDALLQEFESQGFTKLGLFTTEDNGGLIVYRDGSDIPTYTDFNLLELFAYEDLSTRIIPAVQLGENGPIIPSSVLTYHISAFADAQAWENAGQHFERDLPPGDVFSPTTSRYRYAEVQPQFVPLFETDILDLDKPQDKVIAHIGSRPEASGSYEPKPDAAYIRVASIYIVALETQGNAQGGLTIDLTEGTSLTLNHQGRTHIIADADFSSQGTNGGPEEITLSNEYLRRASYDRLKFELEGNDLVISHRYSNDSTYFEDMRIPALNLEEITLGSPGVSVSIDRLREGALEFNAQDVLLYPERTARALGLPYNESALNPLDLPLQTPIRFADADVSETPTAGLPINLTAADVQIKS